MHLVYDVYFPAYRCRFSEDEGESRFDFWSWRSGSLEVLGVWSIMGSAALLPKDIRDQRRHFGSDREHTRRLHTRCLMVVNG